MNLRQEIKRDISKAISNFLFDSKLAQSEQFQISNSEVEAFRSDNTEHGDYTSNVAFRLATSNKQQAISNEAQLYHSPMEIAKDLADSLKSQPYIEKLEVKEPGFINFFIKPEIWQKEVAKVLKKSQKYGSCKTGQGKKARVEFVSANPTGPLHFGNARGGPVGDTLASVLEFCGWEVFREYYHNDVGVQVEKLGDSIVKVASGKKLYDQEYKGEYIAELAKKIGKVKSGKEAGAKAIKILLEEILADCKLMGIKFDKVYAESDFIKSGQTVEAIKHLRKKGFLKKQEGATWFFPSDEFLGDRETVVIKSDGSYTYFANDIAYHRLKFEEGYDLVVDVFGANHHGHVPRLQAVVSSFGFDVSRFHVILYQWVRFKRGSEVVKMSKRAGTFVTSREVLDEVGRDALRFFILMHDYNSHIDFDLDLARERSSKNPVYYVQYAHARIASILAKSEIQYSYLAGRQALSEKANFLLLNTNYELDLIRQILHLPELVDDIGESFAVHQLTNYARDLADAFHNFYENCRVLEEKEELKEARLALCMAAKIALANTLRLIGVSAPDKM